jgi:Domain of unknown function (DUF1707)
LYGRCGSPSRRARSAPQTEQSQQNAADAFEGAREVSARVGGWEDLRATDAARERTAATLRQALVDGSLNVDETEHRLATTYAAQHNHELSAVVADLPQRDRSSALSGAAWSRHRRGWPVAVLLAVMVITLLAGFEFGGQHHVWPLWLLALILVRSLWWRGRWSGDRRGSGERPSAGSAG